jgi:hypothetical protein
MEDDMNGFSNGSLVGPQLPALSMARDAARIVITAVLAGAGFAVLLALAVVSLTVISPPAGASGAPVMGSSEPALTTSATSELPGAQSGGGVISETQAAQALPANIPPSQPRKGGFGSLAGLPTPAQWSLVLALLAGAIALIVYLRRKT